MTQSNPYKSKPYEHLKQAEEYAEYADTDHFEADDLWRLTRAVLSLAHATIAQAQMTGQQRMP